jgi:predicted glycosyltransferase
LLRHAIKNQSDIEVKTRDRPRTAAALKIAMEIAQKREAAKMAQKLTTPPKPYTPKELSTEELVPMIGNEGKTYVKFPTVFTLVLLGHLRH